MSIEEKFALAIENHKKNKLKTAEELYRQILLEDPKNIETIFRLGSLSIQKKKFDEARKLLSQVVQINPNHAKAQNNLGAVFQELKQNQEAIDCYKKAIKINPNLSDTYCNLALLYMNINKPTEALEYCNKSLNLVPDMLKAINLKSEILKKSIPSWHTPMINDAERNNFYYSALKSIIKNNSSVLEIGAGSGLLSIMAANLGAKKVDSCETNKMMAKVAKEIIADNNLNKKINIIEKNSNDISVGNDINEQADILVSEIFSSNLLSEDVLPSIEDAKQRLIKKDARIIPEHGSIMISLFGGEGIGKNIYTEKFNNIKLKKFNNITPKKHILHRQDLKIDLMSDAVQVFHFDFINKNYFPPENKKIKIKSNKNGKCFGIAQWIKLEMNDGLKFENHPSNITDASGWQRILYIFDNPLNLSSGQELVITAKHERNIVWFFLDKI